jgi:hypothetical protein
MKQQLFALALIAPIAVGGAVAEICAQQGSKLGEAIADLDKGAILAGAVFAMSNPRRANPSKLRDLSLK